MPSNTPTPDCPQTFNLPSICICSLKSVGRRTRRRLLSRWSRRASARRTLPSRYSSTFPSKYSAGTWPRAGHVVTAHCAHGSGRFGLASGSPSLVLSSYGDSRNRQFPLRFSYFWCFKPCLGRSPGECTTSMDDESLTYCVALYNLLASQPSILKYQTR